MSQILLVVLKYFKIKKHCSDLYKDLTRIKSEDYLT